MSPTQTLDMAARLSERDWQILASVKAFKYLTTRQLSRQHFGLKAAVGTIPRHANRALARLRALGLLVNLQRRIGGVRAGSGGYIWQVTDLAYRLLAFHFGEPIDTRKRTYEPGTTFLDHTLAIAEVVITLQEATVGGEVRLKRIQLEPESWRSYLGSAAETAWLKPDLAAITTTAGYEDHWFFEVDRATEPPGRIVKKCLQYQDYRRTDREQNKYGLFPAVTWVVPNERRQGQLQHRLKEAPVIDQGLFTIVMPNQLAQLVGGGASSFNNQQSVTAEDKGQ
jgi:hypothetical protein